MTDPVETTTAPAASPTTQASFTERVDGLSLEQALIDFEVANARVVDLTHRLTDLNRELLELRSEHERLRIAHNSSLARRAAPKLAVEAGAHQALRVARAVKRRLR
ncbi:hypothetical protein [Modestobacter versicolor]|uniref:hypothetical protein n=1 Tax=Modestobacter versicolor TaxID=429133 RepID=UPI0034DE6B52